eukprot:1157640-Pelagomonas_calceolata.AAC.3
MDMCLTLCPWPAGVSAAANPCCRYVSLPMPSTRQLLPPCCSAAAVLELLWVKVASDGTCCLLRDGCGAGDGVEGPQNTACSRTKACNLPLNEHIMDLRDSSLSLWSCPVPSKKLDKLFKKECRVTKPVPPKLHSSHIKRDVGKMKGYSLKLHLRLRVCLGALLPAVARKPPAGPSPGPAHRGAREARKRAGQGHPLHAGGVCAVWEGAALDVVRHCFFLKGLPLRIALAYTHTMADILAQAQSSILSMFLFDRAVATV